MYIISLDMIQLLLCALVSVHTGTIELTKNFIICFVVYVRAAGSKSGGLGVYIGGAAMGPSLSA